MPEQLMTAQEAAKDILFGSIAGMVAEAFEYPFDLAKVRLQAQLLVPSSSTAMRFEGPMHCLVQTWKEEGTRGLYRGLPAPLFGAVTGTASLFLAYSAFQNIIRKLSAPDPSLSPSHHPHAALSISQLGLAAASAGFVTSFILTPIELVKCRMQVQMMNFPVSNVPPISGAPGHISRRPFKDLHPYTQDSGRIAMYDLAYNKVSSTMAPSAPFSAAIPPAHPPGPIALIRSIVNVYGVRGLWLGHSSTLLRETGSCAVWFVAKEWVARKLVEHRLRHAPRSSQPGTSPSTWESALSGAIAGAVAVLMFYPADTIKSAIQTEEELRPKGKATGVAKGTVLSTFNKMYVRHGFKGFYAGCGMTVVRAVPSSGIIFVVYDGLSAWFA